MDDVNHVSERQVRLIACPHPFSVDRVEHCVPAGDSIAALLTGIGLQPDGIFARVFIDDQFIPQARWEYAVPAAGQLVTVRVIPTDARSGQDKDALRIVAMIGVIAASFAAPPLLGLTAGTVSFGIAAGSIAIGGSLDINRLLGKRP